MNSKIDIKNIILLTGFYCANYVGAAFASGREMLQFFTAYGLKGYLGLGFMSAVYFSFGLIMMNIVRKASLGDDPYELFTYLCGKKIGQIFIWLFPVLFICDMIMMNAGAGANLTETLGTPGIVGRCLIIVSALTVCLGLNKIVDIISRIGPAIVVVMILIAVVSIVNCPVSITDAAAVIPSLDVYSSGANWFIGAFKYTANCAFCLIPVFFICGSRINSGKEGAVLSLTQVLALSLMVALTITSLLMNIESVYSYQIPNLQLLELYAPAFKTAFSIILMVCTYSGLTVQTWTVVRKFSEEGTKRYYILILVIAVLGVILSGTMPFSSLLNIVMSTGMFISIAFVICATARHFAKTRK